MKKITYLLILLNISLLNCSKDDDQKLSSENKIISFKIFNGEQEHIGQIDHNSKTIKITTNDLDLSQPITPIIEISENATISPSESSSQIFSQNIYYTVTAENGNEAIYNVMATSSDNKITSFAITPNDTTFYGEINESNNTITIETIGLELNSVLIPEIEFSPNATIYPNSSTPKDFNEPIEYSVTAHNGDQSTYTIITNNTSLSDEKKILSFAFNIDGEVFEGVIDHSNLIIDIDTYKEPINISPNISISEGATITPNSNDPQNFLTDVEYTVTAANQTSNTYTVKTKWISFNTLNSAYNTSDLMTKYFSNATPYIRTTHIDLTLPNSKIILENNNNSYELSFNGYDSYVYEDVLYTLFQIEFPVNLVTANNYKLKYVVDDQVKSTSNFEIDILADNVPDITASNQSLYNFYDNLVLTGNNLVPGLRIVAHNGGTYQYNQSYISVNSNATELTLPLDTNHIMFPSYAGQPSPLNTPIVIYYNGRYGKTINVDFY